MSDSGTGIREEAFRAAAAAVDRFLGRIDEDTVEQVGRVGPAARDRFRAEIGRVVDLNLDLVKNAFGLYGNLLDPDNFGSQRDDSLDLGSTAPGRPAATVLWLHNFDDEPMDEVGLVGSGLVAPDMGSLDHPRWSFSPVKFTVPARSALPVMVELEVPEGTPPGSYVGTVAPQGLEAEPIAVRVEVAGMGPVEHESW